MCGIFGIISNRKLQIEKLNEVSSVIEHRGPDDAGFLLFNPEQHGAFAGKDSIKDINLPSLSIATNTEFHSAFLHRRLSIIDLSATGHQPMSYDNEKLWIVFNGEIYNYIEIKKELADEGFVFKSKSDTEVVLAAYKKWGTNCVEKFNGMWAFAIWDKISNKIFISRDRFGVKPLFYYFKNNEFIFCSEIKGIKKYLSSKLTVNKTEIISFAAEGQVRNGNEQTIFNEINQLIPGYNLMYDKGKIIVSRFWSINLKANNNSFAENSDSFLELFNQSILYRMRSDVPVGSCLSGGIDSSSIVAYASYQSKLKIHTFSAVWPGEKCDESSYIKSVNKKWNCFSHTFVPDFENNFLELVDKLIWHQEIPLPGGSLIAQWFVMQEAKKAGVKVLLDGQGADEVLGGYPRYIIPYLNELLFSLKWKEINANYSDLKNNNYSLKRMAGIQKNKITQSKKSHFTLSEDVTSLLKKEKKYHRYNSLAEYLKFDIEENCLPALLHFEDRNSMAHSVETRIPFLDFKLAEFCVNIPAEQKIKGTLTKVILRESMKNFLPEEVYSRRDKIGFETPIERIIGNKSGTVYKSMIDYIKSSKLHDLNIFNKKSFDGEILGNEFRLYSLARFMDQWLN